MMKQFHHYERRLFKLTALSVALLQATVLISALQALDS